MINWYNRSWNHVIEALNTNIHNGLSEEEASIRKEKEGNNKIDIRNINSPVKLVFIEILNIWVLVAIFNLALSFYLGHYIVGIFVLIFTLSILILNAVIKYKNEKAFKSLEKLNHSIATVIRGGRIKNLSCEELVTGDLVILDKNVMVPADLRIIESEDLKVKEAIVTGENYISEKYETKIEDRDIPLSEMKNIAFKGSVVVAGTGTGVVFSTGMDTEIGKIVKVLSDEEEEKYGLNRRINKIINRIAFMCLIISSVSLMLLLKGEDIKVVLEIANSILTSFMAPTTLLILSMFTYLLNIILKRKDIYIKDIDLIEGIQNLDVMVLQKIGAISEEQMAVDSIYTNENIINCDDENVLKDNNVERMVNIALLCNNAKFNFETEEGSGELIDIALIKYGKERDLYKRALEVSQRRIFEIPYDTDKRISTTVNKVDNNYRANTKGAVDMLLERCTHIMKNGVEKEITEEDINDIRSADIEMSCKGLRTIGFAYRNFNYQPTTQENIESYLVFVGIMAFYNPLKENIKQTISDLKSRNIKAIMITDDNKLTAYAIGKEIDLVDSTENIISGIEIEYMSEEEFERTVDKISIFTRINDTQKNIIVKALKNKNYKILSTGMNMTELPTLNSSDIGVAVGKGCNNILKRLSDMYIKEDYLNRILSFIDISRYSIKNIYNSLLYIFMVSLTQIIILIMGFLLEGELILSLRKILFLNLIIMPLCSLSILLRKDKNYDIGENVKIIPKMITSYKSYNYVFVALIISLLGYLTYKLNLRYCKDAGVIGMYVVLLGTLIILAYSYDFKNSFEYKFTMILFMLTIFSLLVVVLIESRFLTITFNIKALLVIILMIAIFYIFNKKVKRTLE